MINAKTNSSSTTGEESNRLWTLFCGNTGTGKTAMINSLLNQDVGRSGISTGCGLTEIFKIYTSPTGQCYIDTPGMNDSQRRAQACEEIGKALRQNGYYKVIFVISLNGGRLDPSDQTTIKLILEAAPEIGSAFSVIVNKFSRKEETTLRIEGEKEKVLALLFRSLPFVTNHVFWNPADPQMDVPIPGTEEFPQRFTPSPSLLQFILNAPAVIVHSNQVQEIPSQTYEALKDEIAARSRTLEKCKEEMQKEIDRYKQKAQSAAKLNEKLKFSVGDLILYMTPIVGQAKGIYDLVTGRFN